MQRVLKSSIKKITKKPTEKRPTKKAANTETGLKTHQMFINELFSIHSEQGEAWHVTYVLCVMCYVPTNTEVATVLTSVLSTPTAEESGESVQVVNFNNTGIFQHLSHCEFVNKLLRVQLLKY